MTVFRLFGAAAFAAAILGPSAPATSQQGPGEGKLERLNAAFQKQLAELERKHQGDLIALAAELKGEEATAAYRQVFELAVARDLYREAEPAARRVLADNTLGDAGLKAYARLVDLVAKADRGAFDEALQTMEAIVQRGPEQAPTRVLDPSTALALGEAYVQRLASGGRYDIARRACELISKRASDEGVRSHFANRLRQLELVGQPAPAIEGTDADGKQVRLADLKGQVVLIDFWATWCPPCGPQMARYAELIEAHGDRGFTILGINLDTSGDEPKEKAAVQTSVRAFLAAHNASWPNLVGAPGATNAAEAYRVTEIPSTFLVSADGRVLHVDVTPDRLESLLKNLPR